MVSIEQTILRVILGSIAKAIVDALNSTLGVHVNESYITRERGTALGLSKTISRIGSVIPPYLKNLVSA